MRKAYSVYVVRHQNGEWRWHAYCDPDKIPRRLEKTYKGSVMAPTETSAIRAAMFPKAELFNQEPSK